MNTEANTQLFILKRKLLIGMLCFRMFISGAEYSVILPTALLYIDGFHVSSVFIGLVVASYPLGAIISLPISGYAYDKTKNFKELLIILNTFQITGNIIYSLNYYVWLPILGRFIGGLGDGVISCAAGEITNLYSTQERLAILSLLEIGRVFGLMIGPLLNNFIGAQTYVINEWVLDKTNLPGVIMSCIWFLYQLLCFCCIFNTVKDTEKLLRNEEYELLQKSANVDVCIQTSENLDNNLLIFNDTLDHDEESSYYERSSRSSMSSEVSVTVDLKKNSMEENYWIKSLRSCFSLEFIVIYFAEFILWTIQAQLELLMPYVTEFNYGWTSTTTSFLYIGGSCIILTVFVFMYLLSPRFPIRDSYLVLFSLVLTQASLALIIVEFKNDAIRIREIIFFIICTIAFIGVPFNLVCTRSLTMKMFPSENQGFIQGIYSTSSRISMIVGPIVLSPVLEKRDLYGASASVLCFISILCLFSSLNKIKKKIRNNLNIEKLKEKFVY